MSLEQGSGGIFRNSNIGPGRSGSINPSGSKKTNSGLPANSNKDVTKSEDEEIALSGRYGYQQEAQQTTINEAYYDKVKIPVLQGQAADARAEMPGIYAQINQINQKNSYELPGSNSITDFDDDDGNSFGVNLF